MAVAQKGQSDLTPVVDLLAARLTDPRWHEVLLLTIGYCFVLNSKLRRLKADEQALKATIAELITVTEIAERAVAGLKVTVRECDLTIGERLRLAEHFSAEISQQITAFVLQSPCDHKL